MIQADKAIFSFPDYNGDKPEYYFHFSF